MPKRPVFVTILSILFGFSAVFLPLVILAMVAMLGSRPVTAALILIVFAIAELCAIFACIGLWRGKAIGWECAITYYTWSIFFNASKILDVEHGVEMLAARGMPADETLVYIRHGTRIAWGSVIIIYLALSPRALAWLGIDERRQWRKAVRPLLLGLGMFAAQVAAAMTLGGGAAG
ncbi:MAG: hypothetical protein KDA20_02215 [Phycisphaerales bacterium]|nr:hypothetical protein [Phycisphaerales bacterium]